MSAGAQPSKFQMAKLLMSSKFREQMRVVAEEMNKAGVDINSRVRSSQCVSGPSEKSSS